MDRGELLHLFCDELVKVVHGLNQKIAFYHAAGAALRSLRGHPGFKTGKPFKDELIILALRDRPVRVVGKLGTVECNGDISKRRPKTGCGTYVYACR